MIIIRAKYGDRIKNFAVVILAFLYALQGKIRSCPLYFASLVTLAFIFIFPLKMCRSCQALLFLIIFMNSNTGSYYFLILNINKKPGANPVKIGHLMRFGFQII